MGGGTDSRCIGRVYSLDGAVRLSLNCQYQHMHNFNVTG